jgi:prepilin-type N-terminal cleavage/methylation domain-containing protein/prepilin-type processing-associated H-X9-DG protein
MSKPRWHSNHAARRGGFTLIELMVVISIISLLMSIMLPSLNRARESGQRVVCGSNMRQLTFAWYLYSWDNDDKLCSANTYFNDAPAGFEDKGSDYWVSDGLYEPPPSTNPLGGTEAAIEQGVLWSYAGKTVDVYKCKTDTSELLRSYAISRTMNGKTCNCEHDNIKPFKSWTEIERQAERLVFIDASSRIEWIDGSFCQMDQIDAVSPEWILPDYHSRNITARHGDGCNVTFADIHWEYWKWRDPRTVMLANWEIGPSEASADNPDLERMVEMQRGKGQ